MLIVILGAGASFDSVNLINQGTAMGSAMETRPPLTNHLFQPRDVFRQSINRFPDIRPLVDRLRTAASRGLVLEEVLQEIEAEATDYSLRHRQLLAIRCYLRQVIYDSTSRWSAAANGVTNLHSLVDAVERWRRRADSQVAYVTFNFDLMLEWALADVLHLQFSEFPDYVRANLRLLKPHGSINWAHPTAGPMEPRAGQSTEQTLFEFAGEYHESPDIMMNPGISGFELRPGDSKSYGLVPALALPVRNKRRFVMTNDHLKELSGCVNSASRVIAIGWRGLEGHFADLWKRRNDHFDMMVVSEDLTAAQETQDHMAAEGMSGRFVHLTSTGFSDVMASGELTEFLNSPTPDFVQT